MNQFTGALAAVFLLMGAFALPSWAAEQPADLDGVWINDNPDTRGIARIEIQLTSEHFGDVRTYGSSHPDPCDWGWSRGEFIDYLTNGVQLVGVTVTGTYPTVRKRVFIDLARGKFKARLVRTYGPLTGEIIVDYETFSREGASAVPPSGRPAVVGGTPPPSGPPPSVDCMAVNTNGLTIRQRDGWYQIVDGDNVVGRFAKVDDASMAELTIRTDGLDRMCFVARPDPGLTYWLSAGGIPSTRLPGEDCLPFDPAALQVMHSGDKYILGEPNHALFAFRSEADARNAWQIVL